MLRNSLFLVIFAFLFSTVQTYAQIDSTSPASLRLQKIKETREKAAAIKAERKEALQEKRAAFKEKLQTLKDEKKKAVLEKIDTHMATVNKKRTTKMSEALQKLTEILNRIKTKEAAASQSGQDTSALKSAITDAENAITTATTAVTEQAAKDYAFTIESESTLKASVGSTISQMQNDLKETYKTVIAARQAVKKAMTELEKLKGTKQKSATNSAESSL